MPDEYISLRDYIDTRFEHQEKAVLAALASADRAVSKAEAASERRFEAMNEFRGALADSARLLMPRAEVEQLFRSLTERVDDIGRRVEARDTRGKAWGEGWGLLTSVISIIISIVTVIVVVARFT